MNAHHLGPQISPAQALWSVLWRSVVFFPLGLLLLTLPIAILAAGILLIVWTIEFASIHQWWHAAAGIAGLPFVALAWRSYSRWFTPPTRRS